MSVNAFAFMSIEKFNTLVEEYINKLEPKFREKALISQELANVAKDVLVAGNLQHPANLKKWVMKHFATMRIGEAIHLIEKKSEKFVCIRERLYDVIGGLHEELQHAGYRKTHDCVSYLQHDMHILLKMLTLFSRFANSIVGFHGRL